MGLIFDLIANLVGSSLMPDGSRERRRRCAEMWEERGEFPARQRSQRFGWVHGRGRADQGMLWFTPSHESSAHKHEIADAQLGGRGPAMFGQSRMLTILTQAGDRYDFAVLAEYADRILATLVPDEPLDE